MPYCVWCLAIDVVSFPPRACTLQLNEVLIAITWSQAIPAFQMMKSRRVLTSNARDHGRTLRLLLLVCVWSVTVLYQSSTPNAPARLRQTPLMHIYMSVKNISHDSVSLIDSRFNPHDNALERQRMAGNFREVLR